MGLGKPSSQALVENVQPGFDPLAVHAEVAFPVNGATVNGERGLGIGVIGGYGDEPHRDDIGKAESRRTLNVIELLAFLILRQEFDTRLDGNNVAQKVQML